MTYKLIAHCPHLDDRIETTTETRADTGYAKVSLVKSLWYLSMLIAWVWGGFVFFTWGAVGVFFLTSIITLCGGHSLGMHRLFIHQSYECPKWLYYFGVWLGTIVGLGGPLTMMRTHDLRDWAQRQKRCHAYPAQSESKLKDFYWQVGDLCSGEFVAASWYPSQGIGPWGGMPIMRRHRQL